MGEDSSATCPSVYIEGTLYNTCTANTMIGLKNKNIARYTADLSQGPQIYMGPIKMTLARASCSPTCVCFMS